MLEKIAVDANILISFLIRGKAYVILRSLYGKTVFVTTEGKIEEVRRSLTAIAAKRKLNLPALLEGVDALPVDVVPLSLFKSAWETAAKRIGPRDPTDTDLLALGLRCIFPFGARTRTLKGVGRKFILRNRCCRLSIREQGPTASREMTLCPIRDRNRTSSHK